MKKIIILAMVIIQAAVASISVAAPAAMSQESNHREVLTTFGQIKGIEADRVLVVGEGDQKAVNLLITADTYVIDGNSGEAIALKSLKPNIPVKAYYGPQLTRSIPPQGKAIALVSGDLDKTSWFYLKVKDIERLTDGSVRVLDVNKDCLITILPTEFTAIDSIKIGSELLVSYKMMTMSLPGQAVSEKTILLKAGADLVIDGADDQSSLVVQDGTIYLPLRATLNKLGYAVEWQSDSKSVLVSKGARSANLSIGSNIYGKMKMRVDLNNAPLLIDNVSYVPMDFFTQILDLIVETKNIPSK